MRKLVAALFLFVLLFPAGQSLSAAPKDWTAIGDSLTVWLQQRTGVVSKAKIRRSLVRSGKVDFYFTSDLGDYPWRDADINWLKAVLKDSIPSGSRMGEVFVRNVKLEEYAVPELKSDGRPLDVAFSIKDPDNSPTVRNLSSRSFSKGLDGRHIALWQSHGRYYDHNTGSWKWQRAAVNRTVEDMFTQSFVLKYLMPMLENAGANVFTPRERDTQKLEHIIDNDASFSSERNGCVRRAGVYSEYGEWSDAGTGFADFSEQYSLKDNPFVAGTCRQTQCSPKSTASVRWTPKIEQRGSYAVYVSYRSFPNSTENALYKVRHLGGETSFEVNQKRGGGTWIYLGTFDFAEGESCYVSLSAKGRTSDVVTADAVRIGGGMGKVYREEAGLSGMPAYAEGALYSMPWYGVDSTVTALWDNDYTNDFADRGPWVRMMRDERGIPFDLSLAFHTDAGVTPNDSIVGTLAIYTLLAEGSRKYSNGADRQAGRTLADFVQTQVCSDVRSEFDSGWSRRMLWDKSYSECRTPDVPSMILELLSHQNFADMRYGLDPTFQFVVGRSVYKGILKFLSSYYGRPYVVQPLPVRDFSVKFDSDAALLRWSPGVDSLEETASPKGYRVYTRIDDGAFDNGVDVNTTSWRTAISAGHIYSFKVEAWNEGGYSFPSEILSIGRAEESRELPVLIVNNFTRVSGPTWIDSPSFAGFDARLDAGVPYLNDISYVGDVYDFRRGREWMSDDDPGTGATYDDCACSIVAGNTFDYPYIHGKALLSLGYSFFSTSSGAFAKAPDHTGVLDLICGKQVTTMVGRGEHSPCFSVFTPSMQKAIRTFTEAGGNVIISGADIATDVWSDVFPVASDSLQRDSTIAFVKSVLGYSYLSGHGTRQCSVGGMRYFSRANPFSYFVENPDAIAPVGKNAVTVLRYDGTGKSAAVYYDSSSYRVAAYGFPLEVLESESDRVEVLRRALEFLTGSKEVTESGVAGQ